MTPLNEPSMEDILASIRRIIAEDQSQGLARSGLAGLSRRNQPSEAPEVKGPGPVAEVPDAPGVEADHPTAAAQEADLHEGSQGDMLRNSYESEVSMETSEADEGQAFPTLEPEAFTPPAPVGAAVDFVQPTFEPHRPDAIVRHGGEAEPLVSPAAGASITSSFQALAESVVLGDPGLVERIMRETMRPLLKDWLDDHLPSIVERLVRTEIERVARGGRGRD